MKTPDLIKILIESAASFAGIDPISILGKSRTRVACEARWACFIILRKRGHTFCDIGRMFGRDHGTVIHGLSMAASNQGDREEYFRELCKFVRDSINTNVSLSNQPPTQTTEGICKH